MIKSSDFLSSLETISQLRILDLSWNQIRDGDIRPICHSLKVFVFVRLISNEYSVRRINRLND